MALERGSHSSQYLYHIPLSTKCTMTSKTLWCYIHWYTARE